MILFNKFFYGTFVCLSVCAVLRASAESDYDNSEAEYQHPENPNSEDNDHHKLGTFIENEHQAGDSDKALFMAFIRKPNKKFCNGVFISSQHVLTTASCVSEYEKNLKHISVSYGAYNIDSRNAKKAKVKEIQINPGYFGELSDRDEKESKVIKENLAVLILEKEVKDKNIRIIEIFPEAFLDTTKQTLPPGINVGVYSWGYNCRTENQIKNYSPDLVKTQLNVLWPRICNATFPKDAADEEMVSSVICAQNPEVGVCNSDDGAAMVLDNKLVGIAVNHHLGGENPKYGRQCSAGCIIPFVDLTKYREFINRFIDDEEPNPEPDNHDDGDKKPHNIAPAEPGESDGELKRKEKNKNHEKKKNKKKDKKKKHHKHHGSHDYDY